MSIKATLHHSTVYAYDRPILLSPQLIRLRPAPHTRTGILSYSLKISPEPHFFHWVQDPYGNFQARVNFPDRIRRFEITMDLIADMTVVNPFDFFIEEYAEHYPFAYTAELQDELAPYLKLQDSSPSLDQWMQNWHEKARTAVRSADDEQRPRSVDYLVELNRHVQQQIGYVVRMEPGVQTPAQTLELQKGSCRDSAWLLVQALRRLGLAARFASGYLIQLKADEKPLEGPAGPEDDFTDLHAWAEVYLPGAGWIGLDPTSGLLTGEGHIPLACTPDPGSAAPVSGFSESCETEFHFEMNVARLPETPRSTRPYDDATYEALLACGEIVEANLQSEGVRLTMGGEPTFVSVHNGDAPEWTIEALGEEKRSKADALLRRLKRRFADTGLLFRGQGKWYPGEPLPRWAYACIFRKDGQPVWHDDSLFASLSEPGSSTIEDAERFLRVLTAELGVSGEHVFPAYEDTYYYLWKERRLPASVDPFDFDLTKDTERKRIADVLAQPDRITGYALPLRSIENGWMTGPWVFRRERIYLLPGDSPMGFRLPLDGLTPIKEDSVQQAELSPMDPRMQMPLAPFRPASADAGSPTGSTGDAGDTERDESGVDTTGATNPEGWNQDLLRTALCVEPRDGRLHIFLPPLSYAEPFLDLVASIERAAKTSNVKILLEGYLCDDPRLNSFRITPDPGVLEVNLHPSANWQELQFKNDVLHDEARSVGLAAEKFLLDGRHTSTGGGNHITLGAEYAVDSPFFRRPDLLPSMIRFFQNHPSLSYLFSGQFLGPTSQHPRIDEARIENLFELETALQQIHAGTQPWNIDRILRHHLTDMTGNTHRTEFSIDKLHAAGTLAGRQGLVELRAFEMPPHRRMVMAQALLVRALVLEFWKEPYTRPLIPYGTALQDRFLLPHYVWKDFQDVLASLKHTALRPEWFAPFFEFRFPLIGQITYDDVQIELRNALEVWHVLGEESTAGGTARFVDSSVERIQARVEGLIQGRHVLTCNGRMVPLRETGRNHEAVAGIRFKAWNPPSALHPTVDVHAPLVFDLYDTYAERSLGGCTYFVGHPGGRNPTTFPVNAQEAEARRKARFWTIGQSGAYKVQAEKSDDAFPHTLDLRRPPQW